MGPLHYSHHFHRIHIRKIVIVRVGDTGTIPFRYSGTNCFNRSVARADSAPGSGNGSPMYFVNSWALGWSRDMQMKGLS